MRRFYPRSRAESDKARAHPPQSEMFLSTLPRGERRMRRDAWMPPVMFLSMLPRGERLPEGLPDFKALDVSIHAPARRATGIRRTLHHASRGFYPRSRAESDVIVVAVAAGGPVSIHAPARRATRRPDLGKLLVGVSIHAPARRATQRLRGDPPAVVVSIHAPARRATWRRGQTPSPRRFLSTLPRGERRRGLPCRDPGRSVSIHAPARRATGSTGSTRQIGNVSIHAPARRATG